MTIDEMIVKYSGNVVLDSEFDEIVLSEYVEHTENNGRSGIDPRLEWFTVYFIDGREMDVYYH